MSCRMLLLAVALACSSVSGARADGNSGAADPALEIGAIHTYASEAQARASCRDPVVWADRYAGYFYRRHDKEYAKTAQGSYACQGNALKGNYWGTSPLSSMAKGHGPGRVFPYTPLPQPPTS